MKRIYEHRPGLFGLASIAGGCSAKSAEARTQGDSTLAGEHHAHSQSEAVKANNSTQSCGSTSGKGSESDRRRRIIRV
jgi:hypothetical protein